MLSMSPIPPPPGSPTNRYAEAPAAAALGKDLFFDKGLSGDGSTACSTCHDPARHFTDGERVHTGLGVGSRNVPTIETAAWQTWFFWDGRADSAWAQATGPIRNPLEMGGSAEGVRARVIDAHGVAWASAFGPVPDDPMVTLALAGKAIEAFERTISPGRSRFDVFVEELRTQGGSSVLTEAEQHGLEVFLDSGCTNCHSGPLFSDMGFHNIGVPQVPKGGMDIGRALGATRVQEDPYNCLGTYSDVAVTPPNALTATDAPGPKPCPELRFLDASFDDWPLAFKTPTLRNVALTAPYMHDGSIATLRGVVELYNELPGTPLIGHRELTLVPLHLTGRESDALVAFLATLTEEDGLDSSAGAAP